MLFGFRHMRENILEGGAAGGGGDSAPAPVVDSAPVIDAGTYTPPEWAKGLNVDHEILRAPMFSSVKDMNDVVKGYYHAQKMVGADKIVIPSKNASTEEWKNYYVKAGLPESFENYKVELPKSFDDANFNAELAKAAYENNIRPDQLQKITDMIDKSNEKMITDYEASQKQALAQTAGELKQEWGEGFEKQLARANRVIKHFGGDEMHTNITKSELSNNKEFIKLMAKIGEKMTGEDSFQYEATSTFAMTKEEARSKMNEMFGDSNSPYMNSQHAQHQEYVDKMLKYQQILAN